MGHPPSPPRGWSSGLGVSVDAHGEGGALPERGPQEGKTGGPERQGPRVRAGAGPDSGLPSPPKDAVRPPPALPCFSSSAWRESAGEFRARSARVTSLPPSSGRRGSPGKSLRRPPRPPGSGGPRPPGSAPTTPSRLRPHLDRAPRSPTLSRAGASRSQWTSARFTEEKIVAPRALWSQPARCWQSGDSGPMLRSVLSLRTCCREAG